MRPRGFKDFVREEGYHGIFLVVAGDDDRLSIHSATDPRESFARLRGSSSATLRLHRFWWLAGRPVSVRVERALKQRFADHQDADGWFNMAPSEAESFIEAALKDIGTWGASEADVIELMERRERRKFGIPSDAPSPLRGVALRTVITLREATGRNEMLCPDPVEFG